MRVSRNSEVMIKRGKIVNNVNGTEVIVFPLQA